MPETTTIKKIYDEIKVLKKDVTFIKKHMVDVDTILTPEEAKRLDESLKEFKEGKSTSLEEFEKEMSK